MPIRRHSRSISNMTEDESQFFLLGRLLLYMDRLLTRYPRLDFEILQALHWALGPEIVEEDLLPLASMLHTEDRRRRYEPLDLTEDIRHSRDFAHLMEQGLRKNNKTEQSAAIDLFKDLIQKRMNHIRCRNSQIEENLDTFRQMFGLSRVETEICLFFLIVSIYEEAQSLFEHHLKCDRYAGRDHLAAILNCASSQISNSMNGKLSRIGILDSHRECVRLESDFVRFLQDAGEDINTKFFKKIEPETLSLDLHNVKKEATQHAVRLLSGPNGNSLLLYGNPGTGKTTYAYGLAREAGLEIFLCKHEGKNKEWERQATVMASVNMASQNKNSVLIIDDCDSLLGTRHLWSFFGAYNDKRWIHDVLESDAKIIFIVNDVNYLEESVIRRFSFSVYFEPFARTQRIHVWKNILQSQRIEHVLTDDQIVGLATLYDVSPGVISLSMGKAAQTAISDQEFYATIILSLEAHEGLRLGGRKPVRKNKPDKDFTIEGLNVTGVELPSLLEELKAFSNHLGENEGVTMSLLLHGPSGAGKSHLARHIAHFLDKDVVVKRGSDLLGPHVGETEANIRAAYEEAESKGVLVIDEAESLVFNRAYAQRSWELSFTNEFLNCLESFRCIQIFTTNRLSDMDPASLRRFNYKLEFGHLKPNGIVIFYKRILQPLIGIDLEKGLEDELKSIDLLTPGDFKTVKTRFAFKAPDQISHEALITALKEEVKVKQIHSGRKVVGF